MDGKPRALVDFIGDIWVILGPTDSVFRGKEGHKFDPRFQGSSIASQQIDVRGAIFIDAGLVGDQRDTSILNEAGSFVE